MIWKQDEDFVAFHKVVSTKILWKPGSLFVVVRYAIVCNALIEPVKNCLFCPSCFSFPTMLVMFPASFRKVVPSNILWKPGSITTVAWCSSALIARGQQSMSSQWSVLHTSYGLTAGKKNLGIERSRELEVCSLSCHGWNFKQVHSQFHLENNFSERQTSH